MTRVVAEAYPALITHYMAADVHETSMNCWCNPLVENSEYSKGTIVYHVSQPREWFWASKTD